MVQYVSPDPNMMLVKRQHYQARAPQCPALANHFHDIDPRNMSHKNMICGEEWNDCSL